MKSYWKKIFMALAVVGTVSFSTLAANDAYAADIYVPEEDYQWIQSSARADYYINKKYIKFGVGSDGYLDMNTLTVPTVKVYDYILINDVVQKRRWRELSLAGYANLAGEVNYLRFDLANETVQVTEHDDIDYEWNTLDSSGEGEVMPIANFSDKDIDGNFYRSIIDYAVRNQDAIIEQSDAKLSPEETKRREEIKKAQEKEAKRLAKEEEKRQKELAKEKAKQEKELAKEKARQEKLAKEASENNS